MPWTAGPVLDQLKTLLEARAGLAGVQVATAAMGDETNPEAIVFFGATGTQTWGQFDTNDPKQDDYTIEGAIWINKPGAGETTAKAARDRASAIFAELEAQLVTDHEVNDLVLIGELTTTRLEQGVNERGRWCQIGFDIRVQGFQ